MEKMESTHGIIPENVQRKAYAVRLHVAHASALVLLILRVGALVEEHLAVALEGEDVGADSVEEPSVLPRPHLLHQT
jgi:hypothetical protein